MATLPGLRDLQVVRSAGDHLASSRVVLDSDLGAFALDLAYQMQIACWVLTLARATGETIVSGAVLRDRTDALLGVSTPGRPRGAIFPYDPKMRVDPTLDSFLLGTSRLYYAPGGLPPGFFSIYQTAVT